jgi:cystathionine beta-lyase
MDTTPILGSRLSELRTTRTSVKWRVFADALPLWVAEMDARPCEPVVEAVTAAVQRGDTGYPLGTALTTAMAGFAKDRWGWEFDPATAMAMADVMISIEAIIRNVTTPAGSVVVSPPCYDSFFGFVATTGRARIDAPLNAAGRLDPSTLREAFEAAKRDGERAAYLLCNPANPTGVVHTRAELEALAELSGDFGVTVIADEIHAPLVHDGDFVPYVTVAGGERGISVWSASKGWNLAGFKAAAAVPGTEAVDLLHRVSDMHTHGLGHIGSIAQAAALEHGRDWLDQVLVELDDRRHQVARLVAERLPGVRMQLPEATYLAWLDCRSLELGDDPATVWREKAGVALSSGPNYGAESGRGFARLNFATSPEIIDEAIDRMAAIA